MEQWTCPRCSGVNRISAAECVGCRWTARQAAVVADAAGAFVDAALAGLGADEVGAILTVDAGKAPRSVTPPRRGSTPPRRMGTPPRPQEREPAAVRRQDTVPGPERLEAVEPGPEPAESELPEPGSELEPEHSTPPRPQEREPAAVRRQDAAPEPERLEAVEPGPEPESEPPEPESDLEPEDPESELEPEPEQEDTWACAMCAKEGIRGDQPECPRCTAVRGRLPKLKPLFEPEPEQETALVPESKPQPQTAMEPESATEPMPQLPLTPSQVSTPRRRPGRFFGEVHARISVDRTVVSEYGHNELHRRLALHIRRQNWSQLVASWTHDGSGAHHLHESRCGDYY